MNKLYEERLRRVNDTMAIKEPDIVPCAPMHMSFPFLYAGYTMAEVNYDIGKAKAGIIKYLNDFQPDMAYGYNMAFCGQMPMLDKLGLKWLQWAGRPGSPLDEKSIIQYLEKPYLEEDVPLFTYKYNKGTGIAENPSAHESFGMNRMAWKSYAPFFTTISSGSKARSAKTPVISVVWRKRKILIIFG